MIDRNRSITKETKLICLCEGNAYQQDWNPSLLLPEIQSDLLVNVQMTDFLANTSRRVLLQNTFGRLYLICFDGFW